MMKLHQLNDRKAYMEFKAFGNKLYTGNRFWRDTEGSVMDLVLNSKSAFSRHSIMYKYFITDGSDVVARFALIHDERLKYYVQLSYFEAVDGVGDFLTLVKQEAKKQFPSCAKMVVGLNGHLNYGAGILLNRFDEVPLFGLPYNHSYYQYFFKNLERKEMVTFRFSMEAYEAWAKYYDVQRSLNGLTVRFMSKKNIKNESSIYTRLNNLAFQKHPFWANRDEAEDLELFYPFRFLLDNENLIIAEVDGQPVGFFLWYPDFNELVSTGRDLNIVDVVKYRLGAKIKSFRFTEIGIIPKYQRSPVALALMSKSLPTLLQNGYKHCEGGFIFEENQASMAFVKRILTRCHGEEPEPYRRFAVYLTDLK